MTTPTNPLIDASVAYMTQKAKEDGVYKEENKSEADPEVLTEYVKSSKETLNEGKFRDFVDEIDAKARNIKKALFNKDPEDPTWEDRKALPRNIKRALFGHKKDK